MNTKKVELNLCGLDGNAYSLMGAFQKQAKKEGWTSEEIEEVLEDARSKDYQHLLCVLLDHTKN